MSSLESFVAGLPKAELHVHQVGSASPRIVAQLAERHPGTVPSDPAALAQFFRFRDFAHFISIYLSVVELVATAEDVRLLTYEVAREMAQAAEAMEYERAAALRDCIKALTAVQSVQAINPSSVAEADVIDGRRLTSFPSIRTDLENAGADVVDEEVVVDDNLITSRKPDDIPAFNQALLAELQAEGQTRH